ncbi:hypothetical protein SCLCIDRAFT_915300 [Scleroderma citrinum Foug A]|uniref:Uncharacterized protein n=1 Tax=Scleroderma citrinum Foug A TaxID=1036808 RepID=A0A0C3A8E5_9AGAM|nr:hypothetical protein SCLCIDRAFT_915300 [Scleroderma citrinum Foug A]
MSSPTPEASTSRKGINKKVKSSKKKSEHTPVVVTEHGKNEGDNPHWAYRPPAGAELLDHTIESEEFEWNVIRDNDDLEIWLIRVPDSIKAKHLEGLEIAPPVSLRTARLGGLTRKNVTHDVWSIGDDDIDVMGGDDVRGLSCLLPRKKKKGKLCIAPKAITRHIIVSAQPPLPTPPENQPIVHQNPARPSYSQDMLKRQFLPYGARSQLNETTAEGPMEVDSTIPVVSAPKEKGTEEKASKGKKRKVEGEPHKKHSK